MVITKNDFIDWKSNPVTKAVMNELDARIQAVAGTLADSAGLDPLNDRFRVGYIQAYRDTIAITIDDVEGAE